MQWRSYTVNLDYNLFQPLLPDVRRAFDNGDGNELGSTSSGQPGKMQAIHSSSALGANVFQYWKSINAVPMIAAACGLCRRDSEVSCDIEFEKKYPINDNFGFHPNIDVVIHNKPEARIKQFAIECKFSEAYGAYKHNGLKQKYLDCEDIWIDIPNLHALARQISPDDKKFNHLHPAQLIKHILAMKRKFSRGGFRLLYLWYDVLGEQGKCHQDEVSEFAKVTEYIKSILLKKAKNRPGRRYFGEAYVSSTIKMIDGWFNSFKWLSSEKWLTGNSLEPVFEKPFHDTLIKYFGFKNLRNLQNESTALYKGNADDLHHKKPVAPDLWIIDKKGNHRFIECKLPGDKIGPHQIAGLLLIKENLKVSEKISVSIANLHSC